MPNRFFTSNFRKSAILALAIVALVQLGLTSWTPPAQTFFGNPLLGQKVDELVQLHRRERVELVVVGHSHAALGVDAKRLEQATDWTTFNLSIPSTDLRMQALLVRDFIVPRIRPKIVLWHVGPQIQSGYRSNQQILDSDAFWLARTSTGRAALPWLGKSLLYQKRTLPGWFVAWRNPRDKAYDDHGYLAAFAKYRDIQAGIIPADVEAVRREREPWQFPIPNAVPVTDNSVVQVESLARADRGPLWQAFEHALRTAEEAGVMVVAFSAPRHRENYMPGGELRRVLDAGDLNEDAERLGRILHEHHVPLINLRYDPQISDQDDLFFDSTHLNRYGAERLTDRLAEFLLAGPESIPAELRSVISPREK